jgi:hypothetical protein
MKLLKSKKGDETLGAGTLAVLIVLAITAIALITFTTTVYTSGVFGEDDRQLCRTSLLGQGIAMHVDKDLIPPKCDTYNIKFYEDKVELNGKQMTVINPETGEKKKNFKTLDDETVNQVVAEQMRLCWWQFWEGKRKFGETMVGYALWNEQGDNCFICNEISFDASVQQNQFTGYYTYIKNTKMSNSDKTYYEYMADSGSMYDEDTYQDKEKLVWEQFAEGIGVYQALYSGKLGTREKIETDIKFDTTKSYVIIFDREGQAGSLLRTGVEKTDQGLSSTITYFTYVIPKDQMPKVCDSIEHGEISS